MKRGKIRDRAKKTRKQVKYWLRGLKYRLFEKPLDKDTRALFLLGTGRTGSTTLSRLLDLSKHITSAHELRPKTFALSTDIYDSGRYDDPAIMDAVFCGQRLYVYNKAVRKGNLVAEISPFLSFCAPALAKAFPNSKFIYMHRRPEEFVRSAMRRGWYHNNKYDAVRLTPKAGTKDYEAWESWPQFDKICWLWKEYNSVCLHLYDRLADNRKMTLPCADFFENPEGSSKSIFRFLDLPMIPLEKANNQMQVPVNAQETGSFPRSSEWTSAQRQRLECIAGEMMMKLGYL